MVRTVVFFQKWSRGRGRTYVFLQKSRFWGRIQGAVIFEFNFYFDLEHSWSRGPGCALLPGVPLTPSIPGSRPGEPRTRVYPNKTLLNLY